MECPPSAVGFQCHLEEFNAFSSHFTLTSEEWRENMLNTVKSSDIKWRMHLYIHTAGSIHIHITASHYLIKGTGEYLKWADFSKWLLCLRQYFVSLEDHVWPTVHMVYRYRIRSMVTCELQEWKKEMSYSISHAQEVDTRSFGSDWPEPGSTCQYMWEFIPYPYRRKWAMRGESSYYIQPIWNKSS